MVIHIRRVLRRLLFVVLVLISTIILHSGYIWILELLETKDPYRAPQGAAVKVLEQAEEELPSQARIWDRLRFFYWYGE
jgi:hypothetical protein